MGYRYNPFTGNFDRVEGTGGGGTVDSLTGDSGGAVGPDGANNINLFGNPDIDVVGSPGSFTLQMTNLTAWSKYVVDPTSGNSRFTTIQSALDQANADGGGTVVIHPATYTENLTFYDGVHVWGAVGVSQNQGATVTIEGTHTPPTSGQVAFNSICWISTTDVFTSAAAGSTHLAFLNCESAVQNGYFLNLPNWTGTLEIYDNNPQTAGAPFAINDGGINNTGGATILSFSAGIGAGSNTAVMSGLVVLQDMSFGCPVDLQTGANIAAEFAIFDSSVTCSNNSTGFFRSCHMTPHSVVSSFTMNSSAAVEITNTVITTSAANAIAGTGAGTLSLGTITWGNSIGIAGTVTLTKLDLESGVGIFDNLSFDRGVTTLAANGQLWIGSGSGNPAPATLTAGSGIAVANGSNSITITATGSTPLSFPTDSGTAIPAGNALTIAGGTLVNTSGAGSTVTINADDNVVGSIPTDSGTVTPTGNSFTLAGGTLLNTNGAGATATVNADDNVVGSVASDSGTATPTGNSFTIAGGTNISSSASGATVTIAATGHASFSWTEVTMDTSMAVNSGYIANKAGTATAFTLPATATEGEVIRVAGKGATGWTVGQNAGQTIHFGTLSTTTGVGGSLASTDTRDSVELLCETANTDFVVLSSIGNITVV